MNVKYTKIGMLLNKVPYSFIPYVGKVYSQHKADINNFQKYSTQEQKDYIYNKIYSLVEYAIRHIPFYKEFYSVKGFSISQLKSFEDIVNIPIITKSDLQSFPLVYRSCANSLSYQVRTGGSSGSPLTMYKTRAQQIKEMAYYHSAWADLGYSKTSLRLQFVGRKLQNRSIVYDILKNEIICSTQMPFDEILTTLAELNRECQINFLQGYPSVLYEFALYCKSNPLLLAKSRLLQSLNGVFLNSEYPHQLYVKTIESVLGVHVIASYGHTEGAALAFDRGSGEYEIMQSYGYVESVGFSDGVHLIATSYDNMVSPLIRYDTDDLIDQSIFKDGILKSFVMSENGGRNGQFVIDKNGYKISVTSIIFGRHHMLFDYCSQLQICQKSSGDIIVLYVPLPGLPNDINLEKYFDLSDLELNITFKMVKEPIRTISGKVLLLVDYDE